MKTIGIIGGMSWKSSLEYYKIINELVSEKLGGWHSAKIIMHSVDFDEIDLEHHTAEWEKSDAILFDAARKLEQGGADCIILGANTAHALADSIQKIIQIPVLHVTDAVAEKIREKNIQKVGLLGTRHTMEAAFYTGRLKNIHGLDVMVPNEQEREVVNLEISNIILGKKTLQTKQNLVSIINGLIETGAEAIILGCTELPLILNQADFAVPLFDTMRIHAEKAVEYSLS